MPQTLTAPESELSKIAQLPKFAPDIQAALEGIAQKAGNDFLVAYIDGYRSRLQALVNETSQLLGWIEPLRPAPAAVAAPVARKPEVDPAFVKRAKLAAGRLKQRHEVADLRAQMQANRDQGFPSDASERDLERMKDDRVRLFGEDNYVFGLAKGHQMSAAEWRALSDVYRALATEAQGWTKRIAAEPADAARIAALKARFDAAIAPCGHALTHDVDVDWLTSLQPPPAPEPEGKRPEDLATLDDLARAISGAKPAAAPAAPAPSGPSHADRSRLKADVARAKGRIARAEARGGRDDAASLDLRALQTRHRLEFHEDGYVFGFSAAHRMEPDEWEALARAYDELSDALERGVETVRDAERGREAIARIRAAIVPAGRALRHDDDADDLDEEIRFLHPRLGQEEAEDPLRPFLHRLASPPEELERVAELATAILEAGVRPSDPRLREPFLDWADDFEAPALEPLARELRLERERRQRVEAEEEAEAPDPAYLEMRDKVREITRGKRLLMVGGLNREDTRRSIEAELELADLSWPESDEHKTKPSAFDGHVGHADIVVKNRFCRRGYQRALELAKSQGKPAVALLGGYNPRQVVRGIAEALRL